MPPFSLRSCPTILVSLTNSPPPPLLLPVGGNPLEGRGGVEWKQTSAWHLRNRFANSSTPFSRLHSLLPRINTQNKTIHFSFQRKQCAAVESLSANVVESFLFSAGVYMRVVVLLADVLRSWVVISVDAVKSCMVVSTGVVKSDVVALAGLVRSCIIVLTSAAKSCVVVSEGVVESCVVVLARVMKSGVVVLADAVKSFVVVSAGVVRNCVVASASAAKSCVVSANVWCACVDRCIEERRGCVGRRIEEWRGCVADVVKSFIELSAGAVNSCVVSQQMRGVSALTGVLKCGVVVSADVVRSCVVVLAGAVKGCVVVLAGVVRSCAVVSAGAVKGCVVVLAGAAALRDVRVDFPDAVSPGDTVTLKCEYDLEGESLYTVKWYKGRQEFFRFVPKELPHTRVFPLPGINVDVSTISEISTPDVRVSQYPQYPLTMNFFNYTTGRDAASLGPLKKRSDTKSTSASAWEINTSQTMFELSSGNTRLRANNDFTEKFQFMGHFNILHRTGMGSKGGTRLGGCLAWPVPVVSDRASRKVLPETLETGENPRPENGK
ncbi:hypothetical protein PR048_032827 [Dryococelus australis]|uniref:Ig-like domain-containing protein n=1 Tax=Dryococelus australis TaxID=614101 RepID=A0ABQ9G3B0_9NEOP|nr:hypothetical protein PR048_032827 [Dryococelus australis]